MAREIYYTSRSTDETGTEWLIINGDTHYPLNHWTEEEAIRDYTSEEAAIKDTISFMESNGFYD